MEKIKLLLPFTLFFGSIVTSGTAAAQSYCSPNVQMACFYGDKIVRVNFAGINHSDYSCSTDAEGQKDFTSTVAAATVTAGSNYTISVDVENSFDTGTERIRVWIDFNRDYVFQASESFDLGIGTGNTTLSKTISIPADATPGTTRMRVMYRRTSSNQLNAGDACHSYGNYRGQLKDYAVTITIPTPMGDVCRVDSFTASETGHSFSGETHLSWTTSLEKDIDHFTVFRSADGGKKREKVGEIKAAGHSEALVTYRLSDPNAPVGDTYYHLVQTGTDFTETELKTIFFFKKGAVEIHPNPFDQQLVIHHKNAVFRLFDTALREVYVESYNDGKHTFLNTTALETGIYFLTLEHDSQTYKLIKK